jgi:sulfur carrier protein
MESERESVQVTMIVTLPDSSSHDIGEEQRTVEAILIRFGINPLEVIVSVGGTVVPENTIVSGDDRIRIIRIAHGG